MLHIFDMSSHFDKKTVFNNFVVLRGLKCLNFLPKVLIFFFQKSQFLKGLKVIFFPLKCQFFDKSHFFSRKFIFLWKLQLFLQKCFKFFKKFISFFYIPDYLFSQYYIKQSNFYSQVAITKSQLFFKHPIFVKPIFISKAAFPLETPNL